MIKSRRNCKEIERKSFGAKTEQKQGKNRGLRDFAASAKSALCCETISQLRNQVWHMSATSQHRSPHFEAAKPLLPFGSPVHSFRSCEMVAKSPCFKILQRTHHEWKSHRHTPILETVGHIFEALPGSQIMHTIFRFESWEVRSPVL